MALEIVFETHSTTEDNERGHATGWLPGRLSERGRREAHALGLRRRDDGIAAVFTSDLHRAVETAEIAFAGTSLPILADWRLRECDYGAMNGAPVAQVQAERGQHLTTPYPGGESWQQAVDRVGRFLPDLRPRWEGLRLLVIGHVATRWAFEHLVDGVALEQLAQAEFGWREGWEYHIDG